MRERSDPLCDLRCMLVLLDTAPFERVVMRSDPHQHGPASSAHREGTTYASSTSHSSSTTVKSRMKLFVVSTTSW